MLNFTQISINNRSLLPVNPGISAIIQKQNFMTVQAATLGKLRYSIVIQKRTKIYKNKNLAEFVTGSKVNISQQFFRQGDKIILDT